MAEIVGRQGEGLFIKEILSRRDLSEYLPRLTDEQFQALAHYMAIEDGERGQQFRAHNFVATTPAGILAELRMAQFRPKKRANGRTVYHFVLSRRGRTDPKVLMAMGDRLICMLGLDKQRTLMSVHDDTANTHLHIAVDARDADGNTISINKGYTHFALEQANAQLCFEHGLIPEAGIEFYANNEGVFRKDGHQVRDAQFKLVTRDAGRLTSAKTIPARLQEAETGRESIQAAMTQIFTSVSEESKTLVELIANLAAQNVDYQLERSGATMSANGVKIRASHISPRASPSKLAQRFGLAFLTPKMAEKRGLPSNSGFFTNDGQGSLQPYKLPTMRWKDDLWLSYLDSEPAKAARQEAEDLKQLPSYQPQHAEPLRQAIKRRQLKLQQQLEAEETEATKWQIDRLNETLRRIENKTRGRPSRRMANSGDHLPLIPSNGTYGVLMSAPSNSVWWVDAWAPGDSIKSRSGIKTVYRRKEVVATFSPTLITFHKATDDDLRKMLKLAKKKWGDDLKIYGDAAFRRKLTRIAAEEDIGIANPELAPFQRYLLGPMHRALKTPAARLDKAFDAVLARAAGKLAKISTRIDVAMSRSLDEHCTALDGSRSHFANQGMSVMDRIANHKEAERHKTALQAQAAERENEARRREVMQIAQERAAECRRLADEQEANRQREARDQARAEQERCVAEEAAKRDFEARELVRVEQERQALKLAEISQIYQALRSGSLVIVECDSKLSVHSTVTNDKNLSATAMIAQEQHRQIMLSHARAHRETADKQLAHAKTSKPRTAIEGITNLISEVQDIANGRWRRPAARAPGIEATAAVVRRIGRGFESALRRIELEEASNARMYAVWEAFELLDAGKGIGSLENNVLTVVAYHEDKPRNILLLDSELTEAHHKINDASGRLDILYDAARDGRIILNPTGAPAAATPRAADLALRASYFWHMKKPRQLILDEIELGNRERLGAEMTVRESGTKIASRQASDIFDITQGNQPPVFTETSGLPAIPAQNKQLTSMEDQKHSGEHNESRRPVGPSMPPPGWSEGYSR